MAQTRTITQKRKSKNKEDRLNQDSKKTLRIKTEEELDEEIKETQTKKKRAQRNAKEEVRKMFTSTLNPYDTPLKWWEVEYVKYAINYPPVKSRLERIMGSHIVQLTDRKYMLRLMDNIRKDNEQLQKVRIESKKVRPPSVISTFLQLSYQTLLVKLQQPRMDKIRLYL